MSLLIVSFIAGMLTILAPCVLPLLPVIVGSSIESGKTKRIVTIVGSFMLSVIIFTLAIKTITTIGDVDQGVWKYASGILLIVVGVFMLVPQYWQVIMYKLGISRSKQFQGEVARSASSWKNVLLGVSMGPVFTSCSPTFAIIISVILDTSLIEALGYIVAYAVGLGLLLFVIGRGGARVVQRLKRASKPNGRFARILALIIIITGVAIITGRDKQVEIWLYDQGLVIDTIEFEENLLDQTGLRE